MEAPDMTDEDYARKLDEMDRVLNDPDVPMQPALIWRLLDEISEHELQAGTKALTPNPL
jgi:hypothetical protein